MLHGVYDEGSESQRMLVAVAQRRETERERGTHTDRLMCGRDAEHPTPG